MLVLKNTRNIYVTEMLIILKTIFKVLSCFLIEGLIFNSSNICDHIGFVRFYL